LHKYLHSTTKPQHQVQSRFLLDVIISKGSPIFQLLPSKDKPLLVWWNSLFVLDLCLDIINGIRAFNFQSNGLSCQRLYKNLHSTTKPQNQVQGRFFLDVVIRKGPSIFKLFPGKDKPLLVWGDTLLILNLGFHIINGI
ncbi:hypothetical protein V8G54_014137, partial [Vigna mungo]